MVNSVFSVKPGVVNRKPKRHLFLSIVIEIPRQRLWTFRYFQILSVLHWGYASEPMIKCAPKSFFLLQFYHVLPIRKVHSFVEVFEAGRSWAEGQSLGLREAAAAPDIPQYPIFDRQWTWQVYIEDVSTMSFLKCPIDSNTLFYGAILIFNVCPGLPLWRRVVGPASNCQRGRVLAEVFWKGGLQGFNVLWIYMVS